MDAIIDIDQLSNYYRPKGNDLKWSLTNEFKERVLKCVLLSVFTCVALVMHSVFSHFSGLLVHVDKRITLAAFKQNLEPFVGVTSTQFKVFRVYANNQEFESVRLNETLSSFSDDNKVSRFS